MDWYYSRSAEQKSPQIDVTGDATRNLLAPVEISPSDGRTTL